jgi:hypothetical protein
MSMAGRVGTGNIDGVATAIAFAAGALFWMWACLPGRLHLLRGVSWPVLKTRTSSPANIAAARLLT